MPDTDWDIAEGLDPEGPSAADLDRFGDELVTCPNCGSQIYDQSEICPKCGHILETPAKRLPLWTILIMILLVGLLLVWML
jgi:predicted nucleic acid-binding Zn ribbon protein